MGRVTGRLQELGLELPQRRSAGQYVGAVRSGNLVFVSGAGPVGPSGIISGKVGAQLDVAAAQEAARLCVLNGLSAIQEAIGDLDRVTRVVKVVGFVNSAPGFNQQHTVMDAASSLLISLFGEAGAHARSSVGVSDLPMDIAVEIEMIVEAAPGG